MRIVDSTISLQELHEMASRMYEKLVKADVDLAQGILIVDMEMHVDGEQQLLEQGSAQSDLWGINLHPELFGSDEFIQFDSVINIRPGQGNSTRGVEDEAIRQRIRAIVHAKVTR